MNRDTYNSIRCPCSLNLNVSTTFLGNLFQCFTTLNIKNFFLRSHLVHVIGDDIKKHWSQYWPLGYTTCHQSPSKHWAFDHSPHTISQLVPCPLNGPPNKFLSFQFGEKNVTDDVPKALLKSRHDISGSSLVTFCDDIIVSVDKVGQAAPALGEAMLVISYHLLLFHVP